MSIDAGHHHLAMELLAAQERIRQLEVERDAAIAELNDARHLNTKLSPHHLEHHLREEALRKEIDALRNAQR